MKLMTIRQNNIIFSSFRLNFTFQEILWSRGSSPKNCLIISMIQSLKKFWIYKTILAKALKNRFISFSILLTYIQSDIQCFTAFVHSFWFTLKLTIVVCLFNNLELKCFKVSNLSLTSMGVVKDFPWFRKIVYFIFPSSWADEIIDLENVFPIMCQWNGIS